MQELFYLVDVRTGTPVGAALGAMLNTAGFVDNSEVDHRKLMLQPIV